MFFETNHHCHVFSMSLFSNCDRQLHKTVTMDYKKTVRIKEEVTDDLCAEPNFMYLEDKFKTEKPSLHIKQDPELKWHVDGSEHNVQVYESSVNVKEELEQHVNQEVLEDPLGISWSTDLIKKDPELNLEADETQNIVVASTRYASNSTRIIKGIEDNHGITFEKSINQGVVHEELEESTEESTNISMYGTHTRGFISEDTVFSTRQKCSLKEKEFHKFSCSVCLQSFPSKYGLIMHVFIHIGDVEPPSYVCKSCGEVFPSGVSLHKHLKISDCDQAVGLGINEKFDCSDDHKHILQGDQDLSFSDEIEKQSSSKETKMSKNSFNDIYDTHTRTADEEKSDRQCNYRTLSTTGNINAHTVQFTAKRLHNCDAGSKHFTQFYDLKQLSLIHTRPSPHKCNTCGKCFIEKDALKKHELLHCGTRPHISDICGKSFTQSGHLQRHGLIHSGQRPHKCDTCGKTFKLLERLRTHTLTHTGQRPNTCDICGKSFTQSSYLKRHGLIHTGERPHKCDICGKTFTYRHNLKRHTLIHTGTRSRPYQCDICDKAFMALTHLKSHALIHSGKRPHKCNVCGKSFTQAGNLKLHALIHTGKRPHKCNTCGKSFSHSYHLKVHELRHTGKRPHKCHICGKSFIQTGDLNRHGRIHTGERPHRCHTCDKSFASATYLKTHTSMHTGKKHECDICGKSFSFLCNMKRHALTHTGEKPHNGGI